MSNTNSAYGRLTGAWQLSVPPGHPRGGFLSVVPQGHRSATRHLTTDTHRLLVACPDGPMPLFLGGGTLPALSSQRATYDVGVVTPYSAEDVEQLLHEQQPRVLLIDVEICDLFGLASLRHLRRLHPETDWVIGWSEPSPRWIEVLIHSRARGCVCWNAGAPELTRALDAVLGGELWFPRAVMGWIYMSLLGGVQNQAPSVLADPHGTAGVDLTAREAQTLALMQRGLTNKQIAERLNISINTVKEHVASVFEKRGLHCRRQVLG